MELFIFFILFISTLQSSAINKKFVEHLKKVAPFEVYEPEENRFKDMTNEELKAMFAYKYHKNNLNEKLTPTAKNSINDDDEFDFRKMYPEYVYPVYDQGKCDAPYVFAGIRMIESRIRIRQQKINLKLSRQYILDCDLYIFGCTNVGEDKGFWNFVDRFGTVKEECYPFTSYEGEIQECTEKKCKDGKEWDVYGYVEKVISNDTETIKANMKEHGVPYASFDIYEDFLNYKSGIYQHVSGELLGKHFTNILGYGIENNVKYWICQNSWGSEWGESGYFRIKFNECNIEEKAINIIL